MIQIDHVADWSGRLFSRFYEQFKTSSNLASLAKNVAGPQLQDLEEAGQSLLSLPSIPNSVGNQLDVIGRIVGQLRGGFSDVVYRTLLQARIRANRSVATVKDLYDVFTLLVGPTASMVYTLRPPASFDLQVLTVVADSFVAVLVKFLGDIKGAGIKGTLIWQEQDDAHTFTFAQASMLSIANNPGDTVLTLYSTSGFPISGSVVIGGSLGNAETKAYTLGLGNTMIVPVLANAHVVGTEVELVGDQGLGFGDSGNPATGGQFSGAAQA